MMSSAESETMIKTFAEAFKIDIDRFRALVKEAKAPQVKWGSKQAKELAENLGVDVSSIKPTGKNGSIVLKDIPGGKKHRSASTKSSPSAFASKIAKDLAQKHGIEPTDITVRGSKDGKKIVKSDIMKYLNEKKNTDNETSDEEPPVKDDSSVSDDDQQSDADQHSDTDN